VLVIPRAHPAVIEAPLAPELRRGAWYAFGAVLLAVVLIAVLNGEGAFVVLQKMASMYPPVLLAAFLLFLAMRWRVRVDAAGVHRRLLWWQSWPWELFECGQAQLARARTFVFPRLPWYRRRVSLNLMAEPASADAYARCLCHWPPLDARVLQEPLLFKIGLFEKVQMDSGGVEVQGLRAASYPWRMVEKVIIARYRRDWPGFIHLRIVLPGRTIWLDNSRRYGRRFSGSSAEAIAAYLEHHLPTGQILICSEEAPTSTEEVDERVRLSGKRRSLQEQNIAGLRGLYFVVCLQMILPLKKHHSRKGDGVLLLHCDNFARCVCI